jgi:hypothetical protein
MRTLRLPSGSLDRHDRTERGFPRRDRKRDAQVAAVRAIARVRPELHFEQQVAGLCLPSAASPWPRGG